VEKTVETDYFSVLKDYFPDIMSWNIIMLIMFFSCFLFQLMPELKDNIAKGEQFASENL